MTEEAYDITERTLERLFTRFGCSHSIGPDAGWSEDTCTLCHNDAVDAAAFLVNELGMFITPKDMVQSLQSDVEDYRFALRSGDEALIALNVDADNLAIAVRMLAVSDDNGYCPACHREIWLWDESAQKHYDHDDVHADDCIVSKARGWLREHDERVAT